MARRQKRHLADMAEPTGERGRQESPTPRARKAVPAQMDHAANPRAARHRRSMARKTPRQEKG